MIILDDCVRWLFRMRVSDYFSGWLSRMTVPGDYFGSIQMADGCFRWLFRMTIPDDYSGCLFQMTFPDDCSGWLFVIQLQIQILATNSYFHARFLLQPIIRLIGPTTDLFLKDGFLLQNYGPDPPWYIFVVKFYKPYGIVLFDESRFSGICTIKELKELNWLCKHIKNVNTFFGHLYER